jgi:hypothetical protein
MLAMLSLCSCSQDFLLCYMADVSYYFLFAKAQLAVLTMNHACVFYIYCTLFCTSFLRENSSHSLAKKLTCYTPCCGVQPAWRPEALRATHQEPA